MKRKPSGSSHHPPTVQAAAVAAVAAQGPTAEQAVRERRTHELSRSAAAAELEEREQRW